MLPLYLPYLVGIGFLNLSISKNNIYFSPSNQIFSNCISGYNLVFANQILQLGRDATNVSLNTFNIRNCSDAILTIIPLILGEEISSTSICICQPSGEFNPASYILYNFEYTKAVCRMRISAVQFK